MRKERPPPENDDSATRGERLQKVLAAAGLGSRRDCEDYIRAGRVEVDRKTVTELGTRVDPAQQEIRVDGEAIRKPQRLYFAVNKPVGVVTTNHDPSGRARVIDLVPTEERVFAVGRLDRSSEGLILVTNDGEFANRLTHPRYGVEKAYLVRIAGSPEARQLERLKKGVHLAEGFARAQSITVKKQHGQSTDLVIVLNEGRNREIRRILARVGHKVLALKRIAVGNVKLADLPVGGWRRLMPTEVEGLLQLAKQKRRAVGKKVQAGLPPGAAAGFKVQTEKAGSIGKEKARERGDNQYLQKQALLDQPLSLDDLLRDDMDEGPLPIAGSDEFAVDEGVEPAENRGGVIDYDGDFSAAPPPRSPRPKKFDKRKSGPRNQHRPKGRDDREKHFRQRPAGKKREDLESQPRESFGKKRGGKRVFGPREEGRGPAGDKAGKYRFRPKQKKKEERPQGTDNQRRGGRRNERAGKQFGKQGGKRKGRR
ncbi:MAG TPA: pseudouridine synthase [Pirellulaceae bacterium]|jgi:23S rRNA pseudouridine2605 synthase